MSTEKKIVRLKSEYAGYDAKPIGEIIKEARKNKNLTQKGLAELASISYVTLSRIETGDSDPTKETLQKISAHIGIPYPELLEKAGYNNARGDGRLFSRDGNTLDTLNLVTSIYRADSDLLSYFQDFEYFGSAENVLVLKYLLKAMRKEVEVAESADNEGSWLSEFFVKTFAALKRFIISSLAVVAS